MTKQIIACIDGSGHAAAVCDAASWAAQRLDAPLTFLHVQSKKSASPTNLSGSIGLGSRQQILNELVELDAKRNKLATEQGRLLLEDAKERVQGEGVHAGVLQRHGELVSTLVELQPNTRLFIMGRRGEDTATLFAHLGSHVEQAIRAVGVPLLVTQGQFTAPRRVLVAFDGSPTMRKAIEQLAKSALLRGLELHLVLVGSDNQTNRDNLTWAATLLQNSGITPRTRILSGDPENVLTEYQRNNGMEMMVMGAYGHSRIRTFFVGSTTTAMIRAAQVPLLVLR